MSSGGHGWSLPAAPRRLHTQGGVEGGGWETSQRPPPTATCPTANGSSWNLGDLHPGRPQGRTGLPWSPLRPLTQAAGHSLSLVLGPPQPGVRAVRSKHPLVLSGSSLILPPARLRDTREGRQFPLRPITNMPLGARASPSPIEKGQGSCWRADTTRDCLPGRTQ